MDTTALSGPGVIIGAVGVEGRAPKSEEGMLFSSNEDSDLKDMRFLLRGGRGDENILELDDSSCMTL